LKPLVMASNIPPSELHGALSPMRSAAMALTFAIALASIPAIAHAAPGRIFLGTHFHTFGNSVPAPNPVVNPANPFPALADPLDFLRRVDPGVPTRALEYPFLTPPLCDGQSASNPLCRPPVAPSRRGSLSSDAFDLPL